MVCESRRHATTQTPLPPEVLIRCVWQTASTPPPRILAATTRGLHFFGLAELQDMTGDQDAEAMRARLLNFDGYLIANGPVIGDGDTIGIDERRTARMTYQQDAEGRALLSLRVPGQ